MREKFVCLFVCLFLVKKKLTRVRERFFQNVEVLIKDKTHESFKG